MDSVGNVSNPEEQQTQSQPEEAERIVRPTLSEVKKSWGFRRSTIARREFMEEIADIALSPPPARRAKSHRGNQTPQTTPQTNTAPKPSHSSRHVIDDLEWSAPSSPVSEEAKPVSETTAGGSLDPSLWQDFGSAFHTAFSLLGGKEGMSVEISHGLLTPDILEATDDMKAPSPQTTVGTEVPENVESIDDMEISEPVALENVEGTKMDNVVVISGQEEDSDEMTLSQIKEQLTSKVRQDCIVMDSDIDQITDVSPGQYDDAPEEEENEKQEEKLEDKEEKSIEIYSNISDSEDYDADALYCICRQKHNKRFMICCDSCQEWFHGDCVGVSETEGCKMEKKSQEYICPPCTTKKLSQLQTESQPQPEPELSLPECLTISPPGGKEEEAEEQLAGKETVVLVVEEEEPTTQPEPESEADMESDDLPVCIGPGCSKHALPDSVYCGTDCILQHAAATMKSLSGTKVPKTRTRSASARLTAQAQQLGKTSKMSAERPEEEGEEEMQEGVGKHKEATSPVACDPSLTDAQATSTPSSKFYTAYDEDSKQVEVDSEAVTSLKPTPEDPPPEDPYIQDPSTDAAPSSVPVSEPSPPQGDCEEKAKKPLKRCVSKKQSVESDSSIPATPETTSLSSAAQTPATTASAYHGTGALIVSKTSYVIPKKPPVPQPEPSQTPASASGQKQSSAPVLLNETRNLPVPPAPIAPSSRPSQPNHQVRQSIQRSLTSILFKRVCDCEDLEIPESEVTKLVASIETEMFEIFRNTDSKYMNKYRTIMFNLKDPRNKGLLYRFVHGEISPFRLVRMSQKDMQAVKAPEPTTKETSEVKDTTDNATSLLQKPEAVKVDLPNLNPTRSDRNMEQKRTLPPPLKARISQANQGSGLPNILTCMLKDTTSEHKTHLFDLKCKICTGQIPDGKEEEPAQKKPRISESRAKNDYVAQPSWKSCAADDSPLLAPPDSPDMDSPTSPLTEPSSRLIIDSPALTIVESPAFPTMDSPASPILESPASPVMESPASPTSDTHKDKTPMRTYTPVVIPAVSTVTITRRDPRTAASRFSALAGGTSGKTTMAQNQPASYAPLKDTSSAVSLVPASPLPPPPPTLPKSILTKPSSSADPRLYGASSRVVISASPDDGETAKFLAKQDILWKGFLNMITVAKFVTKGYLVSGPAENLKVDLPDTIQIGGRILPQTVWDYVAKLKTSVTKELCIIRFHPATEEEEVAYVSLFSYFSSRGRFGVVANNSRSIKDIYLFPLSAKESIPSILQPLEGPGLEKNRPNLLLGLVIIQRSKRPGSLPQEIEEKRPKVHMSKDPMWIPKPPVLYGSDKLEIFQPYDPETPASTTPPESPSCPESPSDSSSSGSLTIPSVLTSVRATPPVSASATVHATQSTSNTTSDKITTTTTSSEKTPLQTILKTLFGNKETDSVVPSEGNSTTLSAAKLSMSSQVSGSMVDPIVQQYGQKSKVKEIEEQENEFDRPYDPEEEYDPADGYGMVAPQSRKILKADGPAPAVSGEDDVAYDPEDETIFEDFQNNIVATKPPAPAQMSDSIPCTIKNSSQLATPVSTSNQASSTAAVLQNLPTGTVVVSAATLTEQQRMLEELNKQIEEQKRQLKEQEEALRQQREAVGMFMAHFSVSDSLMSPPTKSLPLNQLSSLQHGVIPTESRPLESTSKTTDLTQTSDSQIVGSETIKTEDKIPKSEVKSNTDNVAEQDETLENVKESEKYSSAAKSEDSRQRGIVIVKGTAIELPQEGPTSVLLHVHGDGRKRTDTEGVEVRGQGIEVGTSLNTKVVIAKTILHDGILMDIEDRHHPPEEKIPLPFHQDNIGDLLKFLRSQRIQVFRVIHQ
ncbi:hypothetical protein LDENG_00178390 [Lucifuga dentata]|nr:hypothetical protein LDENG_00178390 [Lucifuga dentata]